MPVSPLQRSGTRLHRRVPRASKVLAILLRGLGGGCSGPRDDVDYRAATHPRVEQERSLGEAGCRLSVVVLSIVTSCVTRVGGPRRVALKGGLAHRFITSSLRRHGCLLSPSGRSCCRHDLPGTVGGTSHIGSFWCILLLLLRNAQILVSVIAFSCTYIVNFITVHGVEIRSLDAAYGEGLKSDKNENPTFSGPAAILTIGEDFLASVSLLMILTLVESLVTVVCLGSLIPTR